VSPIAAGVAAAYDEILKNAKAYKGDARIEGVLCAGNGRRRH